jgi:hypothetical protein
MQLALDLTKEPKRRRASRASLTPEQLAARREYDRQKAKVYRERKRADETPEQVELRRRKETARAKFYRDRAKAAMTEEQVAEHKAQRAAYMREWMRNATPEQKASVKATKARRWRETRQATLPKRAADKQYRASVGRCRTCSADRLPGVSHCERCWYKTIAARARLPADAWSRLKEHAETHGLRCAYSGVPLTPGAGMSLDHVIPKSSPNYPGDGDWTNFVWVHKRVNVAKNNMPMDEFLRMIENVYNTCIKKEAHR